VAGEVMADKWTESVKPIGLGALPQSCRAKEVMDDGQLRYAEFHRNAAIQQRREAVIEARMLLAALMSAKRCRSKRAYRRWRGKFRTHPSKTWFTRCTVA